MKNKLVITLTSTALVAGGAASHGDNTRSVPPDKAPAMQAAQLAAMNKAELRKLLARLVQETAPAPKLGAMCYDMALPPLRTEYVCPVCGEKTLYSPEVARTKADELDVCRRLFKEIPNQGALKLDETSFCRKCQPQATDIALKLIIRFDDGTSHATTNITSQDLRLLRDFLNKKLLVAGVQGEESPIKSQLPRLRELLGWKDE
jgi:hypothetical protein